MDDYGLAVAPGDQLYTELWRACAGPLVTVPRAGGLVFYFPQGHIEQVEASMNHISENHMRFDLPSKLLCRVLNVELKVETDTDDVYAETVLMPETIEEKEVAAGSAMARPTAAVRSFCKTLTPTDTSRAHGGLCVPRRHANECFPPLDMSKSPPTQELVVKDLHGREWHFRHIFRGQPKRHILDGDWSVFVNSKRLVAGDTIIFLRGENGELRIGVRRAMRHGGVPSSVMCIHSIYLGILATARHAIATKFMFSVYYKPRTSPTEFIVPYDQYMESVKSNCSLGMRFSMKFEGEKAPEQRYTGIIVGCENLDPLWPDSSWRYLKVRWDGPSIVPRPHRVSPWKIEPVSSPPVPVKPLALSSSRVKIPRKNAPLRPSPELPLLRSQGATKMDIDSSANCRPLWPRLVVYTASSCSSGSISTTYTSGSSHLQSSDDHGGSSSLPATLSMSLVEEIRNKLEHVQFPWLELVEEEREKTREHIKSLVQKFFTTSNSALVLEKWFSDLGVGWVLTITDDESAISRRWLQHFARSWIVALAVIHVFIFAYLDGSRNQEEGAFFLSDSEFARFLLSTFLKILRFVDVIHPGIGHHTLSSNVEATEPAEERLQALIGARDALSATSEQIQLWPHCTPFLGSGGIIDEVSNLRLAKLDKLDKVVWDTVDEIRTSIITSSLTDSHGLEPQTTPDIHLVTRSVTNCIKVISNNYGLVHQIVSTKSSHGKYSNVPEVGKTRSLFNPDDDDDAFAILVMEMISCLQEKLLRVSQLLPDQSLRFLFLLNNTYFMWQQLHPSPRLESYMLALTSKIDEHIRSYLQASWAPVISCLHDPIPLCLGRYSQLAEFKLQFQKTSTAQKLWRVPDPQLRRRLRTVIIEKVNSGLTKYLEDYNIITPGVTPQEIEETLQETFEG